MSDPLESSSDTSRTRGTFRFSEETGDVIQVTMADPALRDRRIELEHAELLRVQRDVLEDRRRR
jgi:hypothetical protein